MNTYRLPSSELKKILDFIKNNRIVGVNQLRAAGIKTEFLADGISRDTYALTGTPWVVKFSKEEAIHIQSKREIEAVKTINKDYPELRKFMPGIVYHDPETFLIVMVRYDIPPYPDREKQAQKLDYELNKNNDWCFADIHPANIGCDRKGRIKVLDCGSFSKSNYLK